jgi:ribonuclease HI
MVRNKRGPHRHHTHGDPQRAGNERYRREAARIIQEKYETHEKIYTDGSKKDDRAGYAVITQNLTYRRRVHEQNTVNSTEQEAIIKAISMTEGTQHDKVIITDSMSTLTAIQGNNHTRNPKTKKLREMIDRLKKRITLLWVPGHMSIPGNEKADEEAKAALEDDLNQNEEYPPKDLENWIKTETTQNIKEQWKNGTNNMKERKAEHKYDGDTRGMTRREQVVFSRLGTGYTRATHGPRMNGINNPQCPFCDTTLTVDHVLWDCKETEEIKRELQMTPEVWKEGEEGMRRIVEYTKRIGFYDGI